MNVMPVVLLCTLISLCLPKIILAQEITITPLPQYSNEFSVQNEPSAIISLLKSFIEGFETFLGGFIFYTPDPLEEVITLKDNSQIPGVTKYRDLFYQITIPILAVIISAIAISKIGSENTYQLKSFATRVVIALALFIIVPPVLSYSIQFNNLLVDKIETTPQFTGFLNDYFDQSQIAINQQQDPEKFGIPSFDISMVGGVFRSLGKFVVQIFLFALTFIFLLGGFIYIGFQFVIRFATLLFLGVLYPIVIPFVLSEKTQGIVLTFFRTWFTFLIQQPAFVLGFAISTDIFTSILEAQGPSVGMLFFYTGFLFFLGGVNMLVARIFGDGWTALSTNMQAGIASGTVSSPVKHRIQEFKKGALGRSLSYSLGNKINNKTKSFVNKDPESKLKVLNRVSNKKGPSIARLSKFGNKSESPFSQSLRNKGFQVKQENIRQGIVSVTGEAYKYEDKNSGLKTFYPTIIEAKQDGIPESKLQKVELKETPFIDLSTFHLTNPNPHNYNAMQQARKHNKTVNEAQVTDASPPDRVKNFLELSQARNESFGIEGVIVERQAKKGTDKIIRLYSHKNYEKH